MYQSRSSISSRAAIAVLTLSVTSKLVACADAGEAAAIDDLGTEAPQDSQAAAPSDAVDIDDAADGATTESALLASAPDATWTTIAKEWGNPATFQLQGTQTVAYGADGYGWIAKDVTGSGVCSNEFFGRDPAPNVFKVCKVRLAAPAPAPTPAPGPTLPTPAPTPQPAPAPTGAVSDTLRVSGRRILDTCGQPFVARGVENFLWKGTDFGPSLESFVLEIAKTGANAVRLLPAIDSFGSDSVNAVEKLIQTATSQGMVVYLSVGVDKRAWFYRSDTKAMLNRYKKWLIIDLIQEATYDDRARWKRETLAAIKEFRQQGYTMPVTMMANQGGRDLPVLLSDGAEVAAADTARNTIFGWQAYWGSKGWYMGHYGMTLAQAAAKIAALNFPVQLGLLQWPDANDPLDYKQLMAVAQSNSIGWLWWDFFLPPNRADSLSTNGKASALSTWGQVVVNTDPNGIAKTAKKVCGK